MSEKAVRVENLGKKYMLHHQERQKYVALRDVIASRAETLARKVMRPFDRRTVRTDREEFWALQDVCFEIKRGESVGIIGRNGAGKSTLLKMLSRITDPTVGRIAIRGRTASLLEVGTGFHPELTGRENIYLNGAILGMPRAEIKHKFDEIVAFAEVEKFLDTPVKRYSSGMYVRLAFAVAAHLEPDILIIDEVLAVGDVAFQKKCLGKMGEVTARDGKTVLFVSHNMQTVSTLTTRSLLLANGRIVCDGPTDEVIAAYSRERTDEKPYFMISPSDTEPRVVRVELQTSLPGNIQRNGDPLEIHIDIASPRPVSGAALSFQIVSAQQQPIVHLWIFDTERPLCRKPGVYRLICRIPTLRLYMGQYSLTLHFAEQMGAKKHQTIEGLCPFEVVLYGKHRDFEWRPGTCAYLEDCEWSIQEP